MERASLQENHKDPRQPVYDDVFDHVRSLGPYQVRTWFTLSFLIFPMHAQYAAVVFVMAAPHFRCATPNVTCVADQCCANCTEYEFAEQMTTTASEWNLVCDRAYLGATLQACFFVGMLLGSFITSNVSDAWGRKKCFFISNAVVLVTGTASSFVDSMAIFGFLRSVIGFGLIGVILSSYVFLMEMVGPTRRSFVAAIEAVIVTTADLFYVFIAYLCREWRPLLLAYTVPGALLLLCWKIFPESPRWLIAHGRLKEAQEVIMKYGPKDRTKSIDAEELRNLLEGIREAQTDQEKVAKKRYTPLDLMRSTKMRKRTMLLSFEWFSVALLGFGGYIFAASLTGNIYTNYAIRTSCRYIGLPLSWFALKKFGRRFTHASASICTAILFCSMLVLYEAHPMASTVLVLMTSVFADINWVTVYLITAELFPTLLRNIALGNGSMCARVGGILAPYVVMIAGLPGMTLALPVTIFTVVALINGLLVFCLPETLFAKMHQTIEEAEAAEDYYGLVCCGKPRRICQRDADVTTIPEMENLNGGEDDYEC